MPRPPCATAPPTLALLGALLSAASALGATVAETLLDEQLALLANKDIKTTVRILRKLNKFFLLEHEEATPPHAPTDAQKQAGYVVFTRNYLEPVYYNTNPRPYEVKSDLKLFVTPGEYEPVSFAVLPLADLQHVAVTCSDLRGPDGATLKAGEVDVRFVRQLARGVKPFMWVVGPEALEPFTQVNVPAGRTTQFWLTVRPPEDAAPGAYEGTVAFKPANKPAAELKLTVVVLPFTLLEDPDMAFGWYYSTPSDPAQLRRELADMRAHGCTSLTLHGPKIRNITADGKVEMDFKGWDELRALCTEFGFNAIKQTDVGFITDAIARIGIKELGPGFDVLRADFYNPHREPVNGYFTISDEKTPLPFPRAMGPMAERFDLEGFVLPPGKSTLELKLGGLSANGGRPLDLSKIKKIAVGCEGNKAVFYLDCIRLEKER